MARTRVVLNPSGVRQLLASSDIRDGITDRAERVLAAAQASAPVLTGEYRAGLHIEQASGPSGVVEVRVAGSSDHDIYVEADTGNLARSLDAAR